MSVDHGTDPLVTPSVLASIPDVLHTLLYEACTKGKNPRQAVLISSNSLANRFIMQRWGIRPSQRKRFKNLFSLVRRHCRTLFEYYLARGQYIWSNGRSCKTWGVYKYDRVRGNLILGFVFLPVDKAFPIHRRTK